MKSQPIVSNQTLREFRKNIRTYVERWIKNTLPGTLSRNPTKRPYCFTVSTGSAIPLRRRSSNHSVLSCLDLEFSPYYFRSIDVEDNIPVDGVFFVHDVFSDDKIDYHICGSDSAFLRVRTEGYGEGLQSSARSIDSYMRPTLAVYWLTNLLRYYRTEAVSIRDGLQKTAQHRFPRTALSKLQSEILISSEGAMISAEIQQYLEFPIRGFIEVKAYLARNRRRMESKSLKEIWEINISRICKTNKDEFSDLNSIILSQTSLISARQTLKLNEFVIFLSVATLALTFFKPVMKFLQEMVLPKFAYFASSFSAAGGM